jgi:CHASE2 domain-containing sensor protein
VVTLHHHGYFTGIEDWWVDSMSRLFRPMPSGDVVLVAITDDDFDRLFESTSPLHPRMLTQLIERVREHVPSVVVIDVLLQPVPYETGDRLESRLQLYDTLQRVSRHDATEWILLESEPWQASGRGLDPKVQAAWEQLHADPLDTVRHHLHWGAAHIQAEAGVIRHVTWPTAQSQLPPNVFEAFLRLPGVANGTLEADTRPHEPLLIRYTGRFNVDAIDRFAFGAGKIIEARTGVRGSLLQAKTIVVGGAHHAGRDYFWTPLGEMPGAAIWAEALDTWVRKDLHREPWWPVELLIETLIGVGGGLLLQRRPVFGYAVCLAILVPAIFFFSWISFAYGFVFINCLPSFFGVQLHQRAELLHENRKLRHVSRQL